jgi:hypothetical protein
MDPLVVLDADSLDWLLRMAAHRAWVAELNRRNRPA